MTPKEWHLEALSCARRALFEYQVANQAMYDCRRALEARQKAEGYTWQSSDAEMANTIARAGGDIPLKLQALVNMLERDPILDVPKDLHSIGGGNEPGVEE